ncbi:hypothetical protein Tco_0222141 [Tanacetum coccineum]
MGLHHSRIQQPPTTPAPPPPPPLATSPYLAVAGVWVLVLQLFIFGILIDIMDKEVPSVKFSLVFGSRGVAHGFESKTFASLRRFKLAISIVFDSEDPLTPNWRLTLGSRLNIIKEDFSNDFDGQHSTDEIDDEDVEVRVDECVGDSDGVGVGANVDECVGDGDGDGDGLGRDDYEVGYAESICEGDEFLVDEA